MPTMAARGSTNHHGIIGGYAPKETSKKDKNKTKKGKQNVQKDRDDGTSLTSYVNKTNDNNVGQWKKSVKKGEIPEPVPQKISKKDFLSGIDFEVVDELALTAPQTLLNQSFWELIHYLTGDDVFDDLVRVRAIYRWITRFDIEAIEVGPEPQPDTPMEYFSKIQCDMGNIPNLFYILCTMAEVPCKIVDGITKNKHYKLGETENTEMKSQWNAVYVQREWRLLDVYWAKTCVMINSGDDDESNPSIARSLHEEEADDEYFFTDAQDLIWTHFPDDDKWQLLKKPVSKSEFLSMLYVRERSRELGIAYPQKNCIIKVKDGKANFELSFPPKRGQKYHLKHNFKRMIPEGEDMRRLDKILHHFILFERHDDKIEFIFNIPVLGRFRVNIFASDPETEGLEKFDLICSVCILSSELSKECLPMPDYPKIGWGPTKISRRLGLIPITHEESSIFTSDGVLHIELEGKQSLKLEMKLVNPYVDNTNTSKYAIMYWNNGKYIIKTRLPQKGIYGMKFFARNAQTMELDNVLNYLIHCSMKKGKVYSLPHIAQDVLGADLAGENLGLMATIHESGYIETKDGHANVEFVIAKSDIELVGELHTNDPEAIPRMRFSPYRKGNKQGFSLDVPIQGEYGFNVYARRKNEPQKLINAYSFLVISHGRNISIGNKNKTLERKIQRQTKEVRTERIKTILNEVSIPVPRGENNLMAFLQKADRSEPQTSDSVDRITEKGIEIYNVKLNDPGDYIFNVFQLEQQCMRLVKSYFITRNDDMNEIEDDSKEVLEIIKEERQLAGTDVTDMERYMTVSRMKTYVDVDKRIEAAQRLAEALQSNDPDLIRQALTQYQISNPDGKDDLITNSKKQIKMLEAKYDLLRAYKARELTNLDRAIAAAYAANEHGIFDQQIIHAKRLRDRLAAVRTMQEMVRNTDNRMIGELRQYNTPPVGVHQTVMASLLLLGYSSAEIQTWKQCQKILGQHGEKSYLTQMSTFDPKDANLALAFEAKKTVEPYSAKQVHAGSREAASIFLWVEQMLRDIEANAGTLGVQIVVPDSSQAKAEIEKTPPPSPRREKKSDKPTFVTLESLLIDPDALEPKYNRHNRLIKQKKTQNPKEAEERSSTKDNEYMKNKTGQNITKFTNQANAPSANGNKDNITRESKSRDTKPKNFIAKNIVHSKSKEHEDHSSYFNNYKKRLEEMDGDDLRSMDGNQSIPEDSGKPVKLVNGTYHGGDPLARRPIREVKEPVEGDKNKLYKDIYHRRKDDKEAIERMWANSVKTK